MTVRFASQLFPVCEECEVNLRMGGMSWAMRKVLHLQHTFEADASVCVLDHHGVCILADLVYFSLSVLRLQPNNVMFRRVHLAMFWSGCSVPGCCAVPRWRQQGTYKDYMMTSITCTCLYQGGAEHA